MAEEWLLAGTDPSGVLAWDRPKEASPRPSPSVRAAARTLVADNLSVVRLQRLTRVETLLASLELAESLPLSPPAKSGATAGKSKRKNG